MNIRRFMTSTIVAATLILAGVFYSHNAHAEDIKGFYRWVEEVVEEVYINKNGNKVAIFVNDKWEVGGGMPGAYYLWIPSYVVCTRFLDELSQVSGIDSFVVRYGGKTKQLFFVEGWMPSNGCPFMLEKIQEVIDSQE